MKTIPKNEELNQASERFNQRLSDEFVSQQVEHYRQEQAQRHQREIETSSRTAEPQQEKLGVKS
jgi:hypothetical protein